MNDTQNIVLEYIKGYIQENGFSPSFREIAKNTPIGSLSHVAYTINRLVAIGLLTFEPGKARTIRIVELADTEPQS